MLGYEITSLGRGWTLQDQSGVMVKLIELLVTKQTDTNPDEWNSLSMEQ